MARARLGLNKMPRQGMEPIRRAGLVDAAIAEIAEAGSLDVTVAKIARRAGVSSALAHHYFGTKDQLLLSAMRHIMGLYGIEVRRRLKGAETPRARLEAIIRASFADSNFRPSVVAAWLNFYVMAQHSQAAARLLRIYQRRLRSNLLHELRPLTADFDRSAEGIAAMIDGFYVREGLTGRQADPNAATGVVLDYLDRLLEPAG